MKSTRNQELDYVLVNLMAHSPNKPDWQIALQYRKMFSARTQYRSFEKNKLFKFDSKNFKKYGTGVMLYFSLLQTLFYTFLIMAAFSIPSLLSNLKGNGLDIYGGQSFAKTLMRSSLANQRYEQFDQIQSDSSIYIDMYASRSIVIFSDILCSLTFFCFLIYWKIRSDQIVEQLISQDALPSYYTLVIKNLPQSYSEKSLCCHFQKMGGQIAQISTVYDYEQILNEIKSFLKLIDEYSVGKLENKQRIYNKIEKKYLQIKNIYENTTPKPVKAIVTFEDMITKKKIRDIYRYQICPRQLKYQGKMIKVKNCKIQPSSIIWQNLHIHINKEFRIGFIIYFILTLILVAALIGLFLANAYSTSNLERDQKFRDTIDYDKQFTYQQAKNDGGIQAIYNFCSKLDYRTFVFEYHNFCKPYYKGYEQKISGILLIASLVISINFICNWIIFQLAEYRRYKTKTQKSRFLIINIFILYFINSALLILLIRIQIDGYSLGKLITSILRLSPQSFSTEAYHDFNRKWYMNIGSQILMIHTVSLIFTPFIQVILGWFISKGRSYLAKRAKTQKEMNQTLKDSDFDFETFYAMILNSCFFTMFYGNALPILYFLSLIAFFSLYVASSIVFHFFSCKPIMLDHTLNNVISKVLCLALVLHQLTSILYFFTQDIFPLSDYLKDKQNQIQYYGNKFSHGVIFILLGIIFSIFGVNYNRSCKIAKRLINNNQDVIDQTPKRKLFSQVFKQNQTYSDNYSCISSYKMQMNPFYLDICYTMTILKMFRNHFDCTHSMHEILQQRVNKSFIRFGQQQEKFKDQSFNKQIQSIHLQNQIENQSQEEVETNRALYK